MSFFGQHARERTIRARTDTIRYEYSSIHNGRYRYDTNTPSISVPGTYIIIPGRSFRERSYFTQWVAHSIQGLNMHHTNLSAQSVLRLVIRRNVRVIDSWLLISLSAGGGGGSQDPVLRRRLGVTGRLVSGYSIPPPPLQPLPYPGSCAVARARHEWRGANVVWSAVLCWCNLLTTAAEPAVMHVISGRYNSSRYDSIRYTQYRFRYDTDPIIVRSLQHALRFINWEVFSSCCSLLLNWCYIWLSHEIYQSITVLHHTRSVAYLVALVVPNMQQI